MTTIIEIGKDKTFTILLIGTDGLPATGKTVQNYIRRVSDGKYWNDAMLSWQNPPVAANTMTEINSTNYPGLYAYTLPGTYITAEDTYVSVYKESTIPAYETEEFMVKEIFTDVDSVLADTNELQTDWTDGGRLDLILDGIASETDASAIASAVWDAVRSSYEDAGSMGEVMKYLRDTLESNIATDILTSEGIITGAIATSESNIRGVDNDDLASLSGQLDALASAVASIQNNVFFSATVLQNYQRPESGTRTVRFYAQVFDGTGAPEDPDSSQLYIQLDGAISGSLIASTLMTREAQGVYYYDYVIDSTDTLEDWTFKFSYNEGAVAKTHYRMSQLSEFSSDLNDIQTKMNAVYGKLPSTAYLMGSSIATGLDDEILAIFGKLPTDYIMGSTDQDPHDGTIDNIYVDTQALLADIADVFTDTQAIKSSIITASGTVTVTSGGNTSFQSDLTDANDFWNDSQVLMLTGSNAGQVRRISDFVSVNGVVTVSAGFNSNPALGDTFIVIARYAPAGSSLTESSIANAVWEELLTGHITIDSAAVWVKDIKAAIDVVDAVVDSIQLDTNDIQSRLPATLIGGLMRAHVQAKDATLPLSAQEKLDVNEQVDIALSDYDGVTQSDLDTAEANIIAEIDANEAKIDTLQIDVTTLLSRLGVPATTIYQAILDTIAEVDENETLILTLTGDLATHDAAIKALIGIPIVDLITDMNNRFDIVDADNQANYDAIIQIQNNTTSVFIVPTALVRPDTGTKPYSMIVLNRDSTGNMEDFDAAPTIQGDYVSGGVLFAPIAMTHDGTGQYSFEYDLPATASLGAVNVKVSALEGGLPIVLIRTTEVTDYDDELAELKADTEKIIAKIEADTPTPTIPTMLEDMEARLTSEIDENQGILETISETAIMHLVVAPVIAMDNGYTKLDNDGYDLPIGSAELPVIDGGETFFPDACFVAIDTGVDREIREVDGQDTNKLILGDSTTILHEDGCDIKAVTSTRMRLYIDALDGSGYMQADSAPAISILSAFGVVAMSTMTWDAATSSYYYDMNFIATEDQAGKRNVIVTAIVDGVTKYQFATFEVLDRPASQVSLDEAVSGGIMPGTFVFDHDGWKDESNIVHEWTDAMAGPLHDDTGKPATGILVRAFLKGDDDQWLLVNNPPFQNYSNIFGHYRGSLEAGTYLFTFYKDNHKWKEVERTIGE